MTDRADGLAACIGTICDPDLAANPVAWHTLHKAGLTRELLREASDGPGWNGRKPFFDKAPAYDSPMWRHLENPMPSPQETRPMTNNLPDAPTVYGLRWRHVKTGGTYHVRMTGLIETTLTPSVIYESEEDGRIWVRPHDEFMDGRFVCIDAEPAALRDQGDQS